MDQSLSSWAEYKGVWWALDTPSAGRVRRGVCWREVNGVNCSGGKVGVAIERGDWKHSGVNEIRPLDHTCVCVCVGGRAVKVTLVHVALLKSYYI